VKKARVGRRISKSPIGTGGPEDSKNSAEGALYHHRPISNIKDPNPFTIVLGRDRDSDPIEFVGHVKRGFRRLNKRNDGDGSIG